ncbi:MAG: AraC family transcriptional regulator [Tannerella sp.]|jgi:AraC-like DNA-binding protein|nr:AraC family transcriptional regulator [Tannerella sp.]
MKPFFQKLVPPTEYSIIFHEEELPHFIVPWHYHPEIEILRVEESTGTCYIGDSIKAFTAGDVCLIGEDLPHWWKSDGIYFEEGSKLNMRAHVIQFRKEIFQTQYHPLPEFVPIHQLVERAKRGIRFLGESRTKIGLQIRKIFRKEGMARIAHLLLLLDMMATENEYECLASIGYTQNMQTSDFHRFNIIHEYLIRHFSEPVSLEDIAAEACLTPSAFCRYFKHRTGKSFSQYLNEFRIGHANRLLAESNIKISTVAHECGFNNLSNFNEQFKKIMNLTPADYRKRFLHE